MSKNPTQDYTEKEAKQRFLTALKAAVNTPPKPLKDIPKKRGKTQRKRAAKRA